MGGTASVVSQVIPSKQTSLKYTPEPLVAPVREPEEKPVESFSKKSFSSIGDTNTIVEMFSSFTFGSAKSQKKSEKSLRIVDVETESFHTHMDSTNALLSPDPSSVINPERFKNFNLFSPLSATKDLISKNRVARKLFIRFIKENQLKWLELLATQNQQKGTKPNKDGLEHSLLSRSMSVSPVASPTSRTSSTLPHSASQNFSNTVINLHSYTVSKPMIYQLQQFQMPSSQSDSSNTTSYEERNTLDITNIMKNLKIKDSLEANALLDCDSKSNDSFDNHTVVQSIHSDGLSGKSFPAIFPGIGKVFPVKDLEGFLYASVLPLFLQSNQFQMMKNNDWSEDCLTQISFSTNGISGNSGVGCVQESRISNIIQQSRSQWKNDALANIQQMFYTLSRGLSEEEMEKTLSHSDWIGKVSSALTSCPFGIVFNKNLHAVDYKETPSTDDEDEEDVDSNKNNTLFREHLPIVYCNRAVISMTGYSSEELLGRNLSVLLPKADQKVIQFPNASQYSISSVTSTQPTANGGYNDRRLVQKYLDYNAQGEKVKVGLIEEKKNHEKFYDFIATMPVYHSRDQQYRYLISLHYDLNDVEARLSDLKVMDELLCLLLMLSNQ